MKQKLTPDVVVKIEKSGNRYNAWDTDGVKRTSEITSGCRKNAYNGGYLLGRFPANTNSGFSWRKISDEAVIETATPDVDLYQWKFLMNTLKFLILYTLLTH